MRREDICGESATASCFGGDGPARNVRVGHNGPMGDVLTYLETQLATFDEVPFNAVDSALLAQFCMARGEGVMPRMRLEERRSEEGRRGSRFAALRERLRARKRKAASGQEPEKVRRFGAEAAREADSAVAVQPAASAAPATAVGKALAEQDNAAEEAQDAAASTDPIRFVDLLRAELFGAMFSGMHQTEMKRQLFLMAASPRFRDLLIYDHVAAFDETLDMQFAATTFVCPGHFAYGGFRGTDTTLTGWREDFNMAYTVPVPAQDLAARYVAAVAADSRIPTRLVLGGHSKGGNLAEYAALTASPAVQERIAHLYNHDGPGFMAGTFSDADYASLAGRMTKQVPEDSMVGILLESGMPTQVVKATGRGFEQHSVYRWDVVEDTAGAAGAVGTTGTAGAAGAAFATVPALPERTERRAEALGVWIASMDGTERKQMVDALFNALKAAGITDAAQLFAGGREWAILRDGVMGTPMADRTVMLNALRGLTRAFSDVTAARNGARRTGKRP